MQFAGYVGASLMAHLMIVWMPVEPDAVEMIPIEDEWLCPRVPNFFIDDRPYFFINDIPYDNAWLSELDNARQLGSSGEPLRRSPLGLFDDDRSRDRFRPDPLTIDDPTVRLDDPHRPSVTRCPVADACTFEGSLDGLDVHRVVHRGQRDFMSCYIAELRDDPILRADVHVEFAIVDGHVVNMRSRQHSLARCFANVVRLIEFPRAPRPTTVHYVFRLRPGY